MPWYGLMLIKLEIWKLFQNPERYMEGEMIWEESNIKRTVLPDQRRFFFRKEEAQENVKLGCVLFIQNVYIYVLFVAPWLENIIISNFWQNPSCHFTGTCVIFTLAYKILSINILYIWHFHVLGYVFIWLLIYRWCLLLTNEQDHIISLCPSLLVQICPHTRMH